MRSKHIVVIGGGAKAAAIVARAHSLKRTHAVPRITVIEQKHVGAGWDSQGGHTDGELLLCNPPEKDVGFPYQWVSRKPGGISPDVDLYRDFSWGTFMVQTERFRSWVDRGRAFPPHRLWASYLQWVFERADCKPMLGEATSIRFVEGKWKVAVQSGSQGKIISADGLVVTGPGKPNDIKVSGNPPSDRYMNSKTFFDMASNLRNSTTAVKIAVIGGGGSAGAITAWLINALGGRPFEIKCLSSKGILYLRGDGHSERRYFTDPQDWRELSDAHRKDLLERTEDSVISAYNKSAIDECDRIEFRKGHVESINWDCGEFRIEQVYGTVRSVVPTDYVVAALGFDLEETVLDLLQVSPKDRKSIDISGSKFNHDLSVPEKLFGPCLHVPALAAFSQGPGFKTLGCLGLLSRRIVEAYCGP